MPSTQFRALVIGSLAVVFAGCQKAEFEKAKPDTIVLVLSSDSVDADDGSITAMAQLLEDGVPIIDRDITIEVADSQGPVTELTVTPDEITSYAVADFTNLRAADTYTVTASAGSGAALIDESAPFVVVPGAPASLAFQVLDSMPITAGEVPAYSSDVFDAWTNQIANPPILLTTTSEEATIVTGGLIEFRRVGTWDVHAYMEGTTLDEIVEVEVEAAAPAQITAQIDRTLADPADTVRIQCNEYDVYSNDRTEQGTFTPLTEVFTTPPSTIAAVAGTAGLFTASGFSSNGAYLARCQNLALNDTKAFSVVPATGTNSVLASVSQNLVDAGLTLTVNCKELDAFGAILPRVATDFAFTLPTNPSGATHDAGAGDASPADGIDFVIGGGQSLDVTGAHVAECARTGLTPDTEDFAVIDLTAPVITQADVTAATGPNGVTPDAKYAPSAVLTVTIDGTDLVGIRRVDLLATGAAAGSFSVVNTTALTNQPQSLTINANAATFSTASMSVRLTDGFGNESTLPVTPGSVQVDRAVGLAASPGVVLRTYFEQTEPTLSPVALAGDGTSLYVMRRDYSAGDFADIVRIAGATSGTLTSFTTGTFPTSDADPGMLFTPAPYAGSSLFYSLDDQIGALDGTDGHLTFSSVTRPWDLAFGDQGFGDRLFWTDFTTGDVFAVDTAGVSTLYADMPFGGSFSLPMVYDSANTRLLVARTIELYGVVDAAGTGTPNLIDAGGPPSDPTDIEISNGKILIAHPAHGLVRRLTLAGADDGVVYTGTGSPLGLHADGSTLWVLEQNSASNGDWRIYKVTGH